MTPVQHDNDRQLVEALRRGDETAFATLLDRYHAALLRLALSYVPDRAVAEEVVQEAWLGLLQSLDRFEGRSSLKTWLFRILLHCATTRRRRERRSVPFAALRDLDSESAEAAVEPDRFLPAGHRWASHWAAPTQRWEDLPEEGTLARELHACLQEALTTLPPGQRAVLTLRDIEGWPADEVCNVLGISATNQRVLLHRARARVRRSLEQYLTQE